jgi:hypothetical protein
MPLECVWQDICSFRLVLPRIGGICGKLRTLSADFTDCGQVIHREPRKKRLKQLEEVEKENPLEAEGESGEGG